MQSPLISCNVPVYNGERYLKEALDSILVQTYRPLEIIVVDDGSTDGTAEVVGSYGDQVRYLRQPSTGPPATRNFGLSAAQGKFVAFLDQDDVWRSEKLAYQMARFHTRPELDLCVTHVCNFWVPELRKEEARFRNHRISRPMPGYYTSTLLARRALFERVGQFNVALWHEDAKDWFLRAAEQGAVMELLSDVLVYHRMHWTNLSRRRASAGRDECLQLLKVSLDRRRRSGLAPQPYKFPTSIKREY